MATPPPILGIPELDRELGPALPPGWLALLEGRSGSGAPLFAKQFAQAGEGLLPVLYYTTFERTEDIQRTFHDFGWPSDGLSVVNLADEYYDRVLRRDLEISRTRERGLTYADLAGVPSVPVRRRTYNLQHRLLSDLAAIDKPFRLVVDSLDFFLEVLAASEVMTMARQVRHLAQQYAGQALLVLQAESHERRVQGLLEDMADLVVELHSERVEKSYEHTFAIRKVRNHPSLTRLAPVTATNRGFVLAPAPAAPDERQR